MNPKEIVGLAEAYMDVYSPERLDEEEQSPMPPRRSAAERKKRAQELGDKQTIKGVVSGYNKTRQPSRQEDPEKYYPKEQYDLYDIILSHLLDEGYADTEESATAIMVNMSEEWRDGIMEADSLAAMAARREKRLASQRKKEGRPTGGGDFGHNYGETAASREARQKADFDRFVGKKKVSEEWKEDIMERDAERGEEDSPAVRAHNKLLKGKDGKPLYPSGRAGYSRKRPFDPRYGSPQR